MKRRRSQDARISIHPQIMSGQETGGKSMSALPAINRGRQSKRISKTRHQIRWEDANYDYLLQRADAEGVSVAVVANAIIRRERNKVPRGIETS